MDECAAQQAGIFLLQVAFTALANMTTAEVNDQPSGTALGDAGSAGLLRYHYS
jgi:hypothetical protein